MHLLRFHRSINVSHRFDPVYSNLTPFSPQQTAPSQAHHHPISHQLPPQAEVRRLDPQDHAIESVRGRERGNIVRHGMIIIEVVVEGEGNIMVVVVVVEVVVVGRGGSMVVVDMSEWFLPFFLLIVFVGFARG
jgi:hypothetical protein